MFDNVDVVAETRRWAGSYNMHSHNGDGVVVENSRNIFGGELVGRVANEQAGLADGTIADDDAPR